MPDLKMLLKFNFLHLGIIMGYWDYIVVNPKLSVASLPTLVTPDDESVQSKVKNIKQMFSFYNYEEDFPSASKEALSYVKKNIAPVSLPIQFWLRPGQTLNLEAGDEFDKAALLCSLFIGLGNVSSKIITLVRGSEKKLAVYCEHNGAVTLFDIESGISEFKTRDEMLRKLGIGTDVSVDAYEFNDRMYNDLT
ncbi:Uncharacterised protein [uncultured archaeon]|nr:Uncharacterised protein [uncultured archaeon]